MKIKIGDTVKVTECELGGKTGLHVGLVGKLVHVGRNIYEVEIEESEICRAKKVSLVQQ